MRELMLLPARGLARLSLPGGPVNTSDRRVALPPRNEINTSMESLIYHFKLVTEGIRVPAGTVYQAVESPRNGMQSSKR